MEDALDLIYSRQHVRDFTDAPVSDEQAEALLKAAMAAPSVQDRRPWHFVVVRNREMLDKLARVHKYAYMLARAQLAVVVCGDQKVSEKYWVEDGCVATQNLLLAARALGLGGVWISIYPKKKHQKAVREMLDIPERMGVLCILAIGTPAKREQIGAKFESDRVHHEEW
ncbi:MAG: nitroreductase family protein [Anaerolineae bacterium]|jgi:nitroreductase